jgi:hypothetical protein
MKKLFITSLLALPVLAMAATPMEVEVEGTKGVLGTQYNYQLDETARQQTADRWFYFGKGYRLSDNNRNRTWVAKDYSEYNSDYDTSKTDDTLYKTAVGEVEAVYVPGVPYNVAMNVKNRTRLGYLMTNGYNGIYKKGDYRREERVAGKFDEWDWKRQDSQEFKNMPDQDISGNFKSVRWNPFRGMRYNYRRGEDASSTPVEVTEEEVTSETQE